MHIIGFGQVVQRFLSLMSGLKNPPVCQVYTRRLLLPSPSYAKVSFATIENYKPSAAHISLLCCSAHEQDILRDSPIDSRVQVAKANKAIVSTLLDRGFFREGTVFVLTNPSEVIAEYIWQTTGNDSVFALGLSHDFRRYQSIFSKLGVGKNNASAFSLDGNHWDFPVAVFDEQSSLCDELKQIFAAEDMEHCIYRLHAMLTQAIRQEFVGYKPPIESGAQALMDVVDALSAHRSILVSGPDVMLNTYVAGSVQFEEGYPCFKPTSPGGAQSIIDDIRARHQKVMKTLSIHEKTPSKMPGAYG